MANSSLFTFRSNVVNFSVKEEKKGLNEIFNFSLKTNNLIAEEFSNFILLCSPAISN